MKKGKQIIKYVYDEVYREEVLFIAGCPYSDVKKELKKFKIYPEDVINAAGAMVCFTREDQPEMTRGDNGLMIWIEDKKDLYTLSHEVMHLCIKIFSLSNQSIDENSTEAFAFYYEFWFKKLWELMTNGK